MMPPEVIELTPFLLTALKIASTLFLLVSIAKLFGADIDRTLFAAFVGLSVFIAYYMFYVSQALAVGLMLLVVYRLWKSGKKPKDVRFVAPEYEGIRRIDDERE